MRRVLVLLFLAAPLHGATMTVDDYAQSLDRMRAALDVGQYDRAHADAQTLLGSDVTASNGSFHTDDTLLKAVIASNRRDLRLQSRLATTAAALRGQRASAVSPADQRVLDDIAQKQSVEALARGGDVLPEQAANIPLMQRIANATERVLNWIGEKVEAFLDWLDRFWPKAHRRGKATPGMRWLIVTIVALIAATIVILAIEVIRRSVRKPAEIAVESAPVSSSRDADPLSRGANEWERYAAQLAAAGRLREAIRAWYHAVLVTLYGTGILQFRKGRTNWEYVAALTPALAWRGEFAQLTRTFEQEWYGSDRSSPDALERCRQLAARILAIARRGGERT